MEMTTPFFPCIDQGVDFYREHLVSESWLLGSFSCFGRLQWPSRSWQPPLSPMKCPIWAHLIIFPWQYLWYTLQSQCKIPVKIKMRCHSGLRLKGVVQYWLSQHEIGHKLEPLFSNLYDDPSQIGTEIEQSSRLRVYFKSVLVEYCPVFNQRLAWGGVMTLTGLCAKRRQAG